MGELEARGAPIGRGSVEYNEKPYTLSSSHGFCMHRARMYHRYSRIKEKYLARLLREPEGVCCKWCTVEEV